MAEYNITMQQKNSSGTYDTLYPATTSDQVSGIYSAEETLNNTVKQLYNVSESAVPNDIFTQLYIGAGKYGFNITVLFPDGTPASNIVLEGVSAIPSGTVTTNTQGVAFGVAEQANPSIVAKSTFVDIKDTTVVPNATGPLTNVTITMEGEGLIYISSTNNYTISSAAKTLSCCAIGGGEGGGGGYTSGYYCYGGRGGDGGNIDNNLNYDLTNNPSKNLSVVIGAGGSRGGSYNRNQSPGGNTTITLGEVLLCTGTGGDHNSPGNGGIGGASISTNGSNYNGRGGTSATVSVLNSMSYPKVSGGGGGGSVSNSQYEKGVGGVGGSPNGGHGGATVTDGIQPGGGGGGGWCGGTSSRNDADNGGAGGAGGAYLLFSFA